MPTATASIHNWGEDRKKPPREPNQVPPAQRFHGEDARALAVRAGDGALHVGARAALDAHAAQVDERVDDLYFGKAPGRLYRRHVVGLMPTAPTQPSAFCSQR